MTGRDLRSLRRFFAEELRVAAPIRRNDAVVEAFAAVPRERFLGPGPWTILPPKSLDTPYRTPDAEPHWLYHDVVVAIDAERNLNNGEPALWARLFDRLDLRRDARVLQVGAGTGYYSAILAEIVGPTGRVIAVEYDPELARRSRANLAPWKQVDVVAGDGTRHDPGTIDFIVAFAGMTHPAPLWLDRLADKGRMLIPVTATDWWGFFLCVTREGDNFAAESFGSVGVFPCAGGRDEDAATRLVDAMRALAGAPVPIRALHRGAPPADDHDVWYAGPGFWLSR
jgi:protein-L-isoaspartate(D-aspartate) O-methyltransferase